MFIIGKVLAALVLSPGLFVVLLIVVIFFLAKAMKKTAIVVAVVTILAIYFLSTVATSSILLTPLENMYPPLTSRVEAHAIVVLGGGYNESSPEYGNASALSRDSEKRAVYGLELSRKYGLPLLFSGGRAFDSKQPGSEAEAAGRLWLSLGMSPDHMTLETESKDTKGNATSVARLAGDGPFILVTSAIHIPRAMFSFQKAGLRVIAAPTDYRAKRTPLSWWDFLPNTSSLQDSFFALHEYLGILYYRLS